MRDLINFIIRKHILFLFLFLEIIALILIIQNNYYHNSFYFNTSNNLIGEFYKSNNKINSYLYLKEENKRLLRENAILHTYSPASFVIHNYKKYKIVNDTLIMQKYKYTYADVINNTTNKTNNYLTLNKGSNHGIKKEMGVISSDGIVGIVVNVSPNFSTVLSLLHKETKISAKLLKQEYKGQLYWDGADYKYAILKDIEKHVKINVGDTVVTSGYSAIFPENITIGTIHEIEVEKSSGFYSITVKLSVNFKKIAHVYIVSNLLRIEQMKLEKNTVIERENL